VNIAFSLDALSSSAQKAWRLNDKDQWTACDFSQDIRTHDKLVHDPKALQQWQNKRLKKTNKGMVVSQKAGFFDFLMQGIFIYPVLHRFSEPTLPNKDDLANCIYTATAGKSQLLFLNLAGQFQRFYTENNPIIGNPNIAVRADIISSPQYLGENVSHAHIDTLYLQFISAWLEHLQCKRLGIFIPELRKTKPEAEIIDEITHWQPQHLPRNI